jgi:hypothetical protein
MLKYVSKLAMDILPSVAATIIGAYIVNHYIVAKPAVDAPAATAASATEPNKVDVRGDVKAAETTPDVANVPPAGVRARGISEKAVFDRSAAEKAVEKSAEKSPEKSEDKPAETASIPAETRRHSPAPREKTAARTVPVTAAPALSAAPPAVAAPGTAAPVEAANAPDANDLARAAIGRLRGTSEGTPHAQEAARVAEPSRVVSAPQASIPQVPTVRPLPPPIMVSTPSGGIFGSGGGSSQQQQPYSDRADDAQRPTPPADIPSAAPLDLRAEAAGPPARERNNVAQDMLSAAKSVFHAVLPQ